MNNKVTKLLNIDFPIILGGMGNVSSAKLAASVSEAGGLGTIGCGTMSANEVKALILEAKSMTDKPLAINIPINMNKDVDEIIDIIIEEKIPVVSLSAGNPAPYISLLHKQNVKCIVIVAAVKHAIKAEAAGADLLVAEGYEAAGILSNFETTTMTLIPQIKQHTQLPIIAAGGIGCSNGFAAALSLGAEGVQMGTRFIATKEAPFHDNYKKEIIQSIDVSTNIIGRSVNKRRRVLVGNYIASLQKKEADNQLTVESFDELTNEDKHIVGALQGNFDDGYINSGQIAGLINNIPTVKELMITMVDDAKDILQSSLNQFKSK